MINELAKTLVGESARNIGVQIDSMAVVDEEKFVEWAKGKLDLILTANKPTETTEPVVEQEYNYKGLIIPQTQQKDFKYTEVDSAYRFKYTSHHRVYHSKYTVFDMQLLSMLLDEDSWESWTDLREAMGMTFQALQKLVYNISKNFFAEWDNYAPMFSKEYGLLYINGIKTDVPIRTAKYIVNCLADSSNPATTLLKLEKSNECSELIYRIIGTNYKNSELVSLFDKPVVEIENNPEKRKEMGL